MTNDKLFLSKWEQIVEYKKVKDWGRDWNQMQFKASELNLYEERNFKAYQTAQEIINNLQEE